jgi:putative transposase
MAANGWHGVTRHRTTRTTVPDPGAPRAEDLVDRDFKVDSPNRLLVTDFTYVHLPGKFGYTAFVIDAFHNRIIGWECSLTKTPDFICRALNQAAELRNREGHPLDLKTIHHSDAGSQYTSEALATVMGLRGLRASIGTVGDAYDNALAETLQSASTNTNASKTDPPSRKAPSNPSNNSKK